MSNPHRSEEEITTILMALVAWAGNASATERYLKAEKGIAIGASTLTAWKTERYADRYQDLREKYQAKLEKAFEGTLDEIIAMATEGTKLAIEKATAALEAGEDKDPGRTAANLSRVTQSSIDKKMTLSGRPTQIVESRNVEEILRGLVARGVLKAPDPPQIEAAT